MPCSVRLCPDDANAPPAMECAILLIYYHGRHIRLKPCGHALSIYFAEHGVYSTSLRKGKMKSFRRCKYWSQACSSSFSEHTMAFAMAGRELISPHKAAVPPSDPVIFTFTPMMAQVIPSITPPGQAFFQSYGEPGRANIRAKPPCLYDDDDARSTEDMTLL